MAREKVFRFKRFSVLNDKTSMKVGTDGVLLGAWCDVAGACRVLDVGTGCGLIALMVAQRNPCARVHGIDIDAGAIGEARHNFEQSPWAERLSAEVADYNECGADEWDLIVSNPPFFTNGVLPPATGRNVARHTTRLDYASLLRHSCELLAAGGVLSIITPADVELAVRRLMVENGLGLRRLTRVIPVAGGQVKRLLWEMVMGDAEPQVESLVIADANGAYSSEYKSLTGEFYLE